MILGLSELGCASLIFLIVEAGIIFGLLFGLLTYATQSLWFRRK